MERKKIPSKINISERTESVKPHHARALLFTGSARHGVGKCHAYQEMKKMVELDRVVNIPPRRHDFADNQEKPRMHFREALLKLY